LGSIARPIVFGSSAEFVGKGYEVRAELGGHERRFNA
jgi:hypothetical protein